MSNESKERVLAKYPDAVAFLFHGYWVTMKREIDARHWTVGATTEEAAWDDAASKLPVATPEPDPRSKIAEFHFGPPTPPAGATDPESQSELQKLRARLEAWETLGRQVSLSLVPTKESVGQIRAAIDAKLGEAR